MSVSESEYTYNPRPSLPEKALLMSSSWSAWDDRWYKGDSRY